MTYQRDCTLPAEFLERLAQEGLDGLPEMIRVVINEAMRLEREKHLAASPYERTPERQGHANGYKPKTMTTRVGDITFDVPQVREGGFYPEALEKGLRSHHRRAHRPGSVFQPGQPGNRAAG
jgi:transposase-like protein